MKCNTPVEKTLLIHKIKQMGYPTGSRVIGGATGKSDEDYVMLHDDVKEIADFIGIKFDIAMCDGDYDDDEDFEFVSFKYEQNFAPVINLIVVPNKQKLEGWKYATDKLIQLAIDGQGYEQNVMTNKSFRVEKFTEFQKEYKDQNRLRCTDKKGFFGK